jgi:hypothetical protein
MRATRLRGRSHDDVLAPSKRGAAGDTAIRHGDSARLATLAQRSELPPRVRALLSGLLERTRSHFLGVLPRTLDEIESALFKLAERAGSNALQQERFASLREIKSNHAQTTSRFLAHVESSLAQIRAPAEFAPVPTQASITARAELELVDSSVLEEDLALQEIASKSEIRNSQALYALSHRLGVIAGGPAATNELLALGPVKLVEAFREAMRAIDLGVESRVLAYRQFDRVALLPISVFYQTLNTWLAEQRVLPNLQWQAAGSKPRAGDGGREPLIDQVAQEALAHQAQQRFGSAPAQQAHDVGDAELFGTLRHLLADRRRNAGIDQSRGSMAPPASRDDLQSVLSVLQRSPDARAKSANAVYDSGQFRDDLLDQLRRAGPHGDALQLAEEDADTVDLIGMLFDYITTNVREGSGAGSLLSRLRVPVLRVALGDKTFFTRRNHPARELLNTIAETGARWFDESDSDADLSRKMQLVVDNVGDDFDGDLSVFENLLGDLGKHMELLARRAEVAERRHIDAAKGRDKLDVARETARAAITRVIQGGSPSPLVRSLLEQAWTDALALSALRHGSDGAEFKRRLGVAIKLARHDAATSAAADQTLRQELDTGLRQVGLHTDDIEGVVAGVFAPPGSADAPTAQQAEHVDHLLKDKVRLGGEPVAQPPVVSAPVPLSAEEKAMLDRMRTIPFGTWFDFVQNQQGASVRRKLAWFSTVTGRCLFVNQRGVRSEDRTLEQLARDMVRGQARMVVSTEPSLIDRAWKAILETLRLGGAQEATA